MTNISAFLSMIAASEGTSTSPATKNNGYDVIVTGIDGKPEIFTDYSTHPFAMGRAPKVINKSGLQSTASGRYQFLLHDWEHYRELLNLPDFGPASQDAWALKLIQEAKGEAFIESGDIYHAIQKCAHLWASLPGAGYSQHENQYSDLQDAYLAAGGILSTDQT